jgi:hypothetical protein
MPLVRHRMAANLTERNSGRETAPQKRGACEWPRPGVRQRSVARVCFRATCHGPFVTNYELHDLSKLGRARIVLGRADG